MFGNLKGMVIVIGPRRAYFIIQHAYSNGKIEEFFGHRSEVHYDILGRKNIHLGSEVSFVAGDRDPGKSRRRARHIRVEDPSLSEIDTNTWREIGRVKKLERKRDKGGVDGFGLIEWGPDGVDILSFRFYNVVSEGIETLAVGDFVEFGINSYEKAGEIKYHAKEICIFYREGESPKTEQLEDSEQVYSPAQKKMTLRELIFQKQD